jgi:hypothetical protein
LKLLKVTLQLATNRKTSVKSSTTWKYIKEKVILRKRFYNSLYAFKTSLFKEIFIVTISFIKCKTRLRYSYKIYLKL